MVLCLSTSKTWAKRNRLAILILGINKFYVLHIVTFWRILYTILFGTIVFSTNQVMGTSTLLVVNVCSLGIELDTSLFWYNHIPNLFLITIRFLDRWCLTNIISTVMLLEYSRNMYTFNVIKKLEIKLISSAIWMF